MTDNVIPFKQPELLIFVCSCGCQSYRIQSDCTIECCNCHDVKAFGEWVKHLPPVLSDPPERTSAGTLIVTAHGSEELAKRRVLRDIELWMRNDELMLLSAFNKSGGGKHWFNLKTEDDKEFLLNRLAEMYAQVKETAL